VKKHFVISEFDQPARHGFQRAAYPPDFYDRLGVLCTMLEVIREAIGNTPITILSGYRSEAYNRKIGGAKHSQHVQGRAADIKCANWTARQVHEAIMERRVRGHLPWLGGLGLYPTFVHVDVRPSDRLVRWTGTRMGS